MRQPTHLTRPFFALFTAAIAGLSLSCGSSSGGGSTGSCDVMGFSGGTANASFSTSGVFTQSPIATGSISKIIPLGNLNPAGHTYPTDHIYLNLSNSAADQVAVVAAAGGTVVNLYQPSGTDYKVIIKVDTSFYYYYDHIHVANGIQSGSTVTAGQQLGTNSGLAGAVDFGVYNFNNSPLAGLLDTCIAQGAAYVDSPLRYYAGALQTTLLGKVTVSGGQTQYGKIDYDQAGKLVGDWALSGHQALDSTDYQLAFTFNVSSLSPRITVGGTLSGGAASYGVQGGATAFASVTTSSGQVDYQLFPTTNGDSTAPGSQYGVLSVQMISDSQIKVEIFPGASTTGTFDGNAQTYSR